MVSFNFQSPNRSGVLSKIMSTLSENGIDVVRLESRAPKFTSEKAPTINFSLDARGNLEQKEMKQALQQLERDQIKI